jgi:peptidyl-prolyl cis-trans isomerase B (cyclophilin B)
LVKNDFYKDLLFHRVIQGFMIQGGDPESKGAASNKMLGEGGPGYTIPAEINPKLIHKKGALAAARMGDNVNPGKESSGSQFYIVQGKIYPPANLQQLSQQTRVGYSEAQAKTYATIGGTPQLDMQYTVFGEVVEGMDVIDKIASQSVNQQLGNRPYADVKFTISLIEN